MNSRDYSQVAGGPQLRPAVRTMRWLAAIKIDFSLLVLVLSLCCFGLAALYSASDGDSGLIRRQAFIVGLGVIAMLTVAQFEMRLVRRVTMYVYLGGLALLGLVLWIGVEANGARSWLDLPGLPSFQPSELMKIIVPAVLAWYLSSRPLPPRLWQIIVAGLLVLVPTALIVLQNDMGTAMLVAMAGFFVLLLAGMSLKLVAAGGLLVLLASPLWYVFVALEHQKNRILSFINPYTDPAGAGYNIIQSQIAIGSGGVYGKGFGEGDQSRLDFIPESNTDFIFAVIAEEFGLAGALVLIGLYALLLARGLLIAVNAHNMFARLLAGGIVLIVFFNVYVNMAMVVGLLPVIGLPLPLISRGGTAIIALFVGFGLLMSINAHSRRSQPPRD
ncbi:MAG: rod shape-determining protein RodA [Gammaproteobacteria bacterium]|nr:rod shape-determining protein RodA [Gammaproteobacteria bacterium]